MKISNPQFRTHFRQNRTVGSWISLGKSEIAEIMAECGFDWLCIDMEHTAITLDIAQDLIRTIESAGSIPLVRIGENTAVLIKRVMDAGAYGVIVPMVNTPEDAEKAVQAAKYPPQGARGVGLGRAQGYGRTFKAYQNWANDGTLVIVQIEHIKAVENIEAILSTPGIDGFIVGPYDLSGSLGIPGQFDHPEMIKALDRIGRYVKSHELPGGYHIVSPDPQAAAKKFAEGYRFVAYSFDALLLSEACRGGLAQIHASVNPVGAQKVKL